MLIEKPVSKILKRHGKGEESNFGKLTLINILLKYENLLDDLIKNDVKELTLYDAKITDLLRNNIVQTFIGVNLYEGILYFSKENFEELLDWLFTIAVINISTPAKSQKGKKEYFDKMILLLEFIDHIKEWAVNSGFQLEILLDKFTKKKNEPTEEVEKTPEIKNGKEGIINKNSPAEE